MLQPSCGAPAFAQLRGLTHLALDLGAEFWPCWSFANVVGALVPLTGLVELDITLYKLAVLPAAIGQLQRLQALQLCCLRSCDFEAGCLHLPSLLSLTFDSCSFADSVVLPAA